MLESYVLTSGRVLGVFLGGDVSGGDQCRRLGRQSCLHLALTFEMTFVPVYTPPPPIWVLQLVLVAAAAFLSGFILPVFPATLLLLP